MNAFLLWMESLDPVKVAATESFHSENHRKSMALHEAEKVRLSCERSRLQEYDAFLARVAEVWANRDAKSDTPKVQGLDEPLSETADRKISKKMADFTPEQMRIAQAVLERREKNGKG